MSFDAHNNEDVKQPGTELVPTVPADAASLVPSEPDDLFGPPAPKAAPARRVTLEQVYRHRYLAAVVALLVAIPGITAAWLLHVPTYEARADVLVKPRKKQVAYRTEEHLGGAGYRQHRNDQVTILRSARLLNRVLDRADVRGTGWYAER